MTTYPIHIVETGDSWMDRVDTLPAVTTLQEAIAAARDAGYRVMENADGGCCETGDATDAHGEHITAHIVTVYPES